MSPKPSVRSNLLLAFLAPAILALCLGALGLWFDVYSLRRDIERAAQVEAGLVALGLRGPMSLDDTLAMREVLTSLAGEPDILAGAVYSPDNKLLVQHSRDPMRTLPLAPAEGRQGETLSVVRDIKMGDRVIGRLLMQVSLQRYSQRLRLYLFTGIGAMCLIVALAATMTRMMQQRIAQPLQTLAAMATQISEQTDYTVRAPAFREAEFDALTQALNHMLDEIQKQNRSLTETNAQLRLTNKELEAFTYSVSHDLRTPLRAIAGYAQVLRELPPANFAEEGADFLTRIEKNSIKMAQLIDDLLAFSKIDAHALELGPVDVTALVKGIWDDIPAAQTERVEFKLDPLPGAIADTALLRQVFSNLLGNAVKYSRNQERPKISVGSMQKDGKTTYIVRDNGVGFSMTYYSKLFGVFQRLHNEKEFEGTGVGLAIVQRIVSRHGGKIWAESEPGNGATFYFTLA